MTIDQITISGILAGAMLLFIWGPWRHDLVAFLALLATLFTGLVPPEKAFAGFGHPATITVAAVLILSKGLSNSGALDLLGRLTTRAAGATSAHVGLLSGIGALLSTAMNNVGALALLMPVAVQSAAKAKRSVALLLMPLSFGTILGGLVTLIGTPPNIIIAAFRGDLTGEPFHMFDFTPVGAPVAVAGLLFIALLGWRLVPAPKRAVASAAERFQVEDYVTEARVPDESKIVGRRIITLEREDKEADITVVGLIRGQKKSHQGIHWREVQAGDILILEANPEELDKFVSKYGLELAGGEEAKSGLLSSEEVSLLEAVVSPGSHMIGRTPAQLALRRRHGVNLLAVSRQGVPFRDRLRSFGFRAGDVLLLQGDADTLAETAAELGCLPLAERGWQMGMRGKANLALAVFAAAILSASTGLLPAAIALAAAAVAMVLLKIVPAREMYDEIDWPVIALLGAMIPVAGALQSTGASALLATTLVELSAGLSPLLVLALVLVLTMTLSDIMNNAATTLVMAPIGVSIAGALGVNADSFLMAVAIGASSAFLTPIGHQNNTLIMGPGGYRFGDYWRMGLPLEILITIIAVPLLALAWPL